MFAQAFFARLSLLPSLLPSILVSFLAAVLVAPPAQAYFSVINNGDLIPPQQFQAIFEPQLVLSRYDGFNAIGRFDVGVSDASSVRGILGFGKVDFQMGAFYKHIPFPDTANQPAIGAEVGFLFARVGGETEFSVRLHPLVSKRFETEIGDLVPYASIPIGVTSGRGETIVPIQVVGGAELRPLNFPNLSFFAELGVNVDKAFSYLSAAIAFRFDEESMKVK